MRVRFIDSKKLDYASASSDFLLSFACTSLFVENRPLIGSSRFVKEKVIGREVGRRNARNKLCKSITKTSIVRESYGMIFKHVSLSYD